MSTSVQYKAAPTKALSMMQQSAITALTAATVTSWTDRHFIIYPFKLGAAI
jgi:hypothetical protein